MHIYALLIVKNVVITLEKSKITQLALAIFIGLIFISSYVSLTNYNSQQTTVTTIPTTYFAQGFASGKVAGYGTPLYFSLTCRNLSARSAASNAISDSLTLLSNNNSVYNFYSTAGNTSVQPGNMSDYQIYSFVSSRLNQSANCVSSSAVTIVSLPSAVNFTIGTQTLEVPVPSADSNVSLVLPMSYTIGTNVKLKLSTLVTANGTVFGQINTIVLK